MRGQKQKLEQMRKPSFQPAGCSLIDWKLSSPQQTLHFLILPQSQWLSLRGVSIKKLHADDMFLTIVLSVGHGVLLGLSAHDSLAVIPFDARVRSYFRARINPCSCFFSLTAPRSFSLTPTTIPGSKYLAFKFMKVLTSPQVCIPWPWAPNMWRTSSFMLVSFIIDTMSVRLSSLGSAMASNF